MKRFSFFIFSLAFGLLFFSASAQDTVSRDNFYFKDCLQRELFPVIDLDGNETWFTVFDRSDTVDLGEEPYCISNSKAILLDATLNAIDSVLLPQERYLFTAQPYFNYKGNCELPNRYKIGDCFYHSSIYWEIHRNPDQDYEGVKIDSIAFQTFNRTTGVYGCVSYPLNTPEARFNQYPQHFHMGGDKFGVILSHAKPMNGFNTQPWQYLGDSSRFIVYQISLGVVKDTTLPIPCTYVGRINNASLIGDKIAFFALGEFNQMWNPKGNLYLIDTSDFSYQAIYDSLGNNDFRFSFTDRSGKPVYHLDFQQVNDSTVIGGPSRKITVDGQKNIVIFLFSLPDWKLKHIVKFPIERYAIFQDHEAEFEKNLGVHGDTIIYAFGQQAADQVPLGFRGAQEVRVVSFSASTGEVFSDVFLELPRGNKMVQHNVHSTQDGGISFFVRNDLGTAEFVFESYLVNYNPFSGVSLREVSTGETVRLHVYPNPAKDFITVDFHGELVGKAVFEIYDLQGRKVLRKELSQTLGNKVEVSALQPGAYSYKLFFNGKALGEKIIIAR